MIRFLSKDLLSGLMFIAFGMTALYFGQKLALGTPVRMGPGYVPRMLAFILLCLGSVIVMVTLYRTADRAEKERYWIPVAGLTVAVFAFSMIPWGANFIATSILGPWMSLWLIAFFSATSTYSSAPTSRIVVNPASSVRFA